MRNQVAPGIVSIYTINMRSQLEIKAKLQRRGEPRGGGKLELWPHVHCEPLNETDPEIRSTSGSAPKSQLASDFHYSKTSALLPDLLLSDSYSSPPTLEQEP